MEDNRNVILVDKNDNPIGICDKNTAHNEKHLHRAFSLFLFNKKGELLLQKRAKDKYHSGGLWSNSCCSHPRPNMNIFEEVQQRVEDELGILCHDVEEKFSFIYETDFASNSEYEFDHVFFGKYDGDVPFNTNEVEEIRWIDIEQLYTEIEENPEKYTYWFMYILKNYKSNFIAN